MRWNNFHFSRTHSVFHHIFYTSTIFFWWIYSFFFFKVARMTEKTRFFFCSVLSNHLITIYLKLFRKDDDTCWGVYFGGVGGLKSILYGQFSRVPLVEGKGRVSLRNLVKERMKKGKQRNDWNLWEIWPPPAWKPWLHLFNIRMQKRQRKKFCFDWSYEMSRHGWWYVFNFTFYTARASKRT